MSKPNEIHIILSDDEDLGGFHLDVQAREHFDVNDEANHTPAEALAATTLSFIGRVVEHIQAQVEAMSNGEDLSEKEAVEEFQMLGYFAADEKSGN